MKVDRPVAREHNGCLWLSVMLLDKFNRPLEVLEILAGDLPAANQDPSEDPTGQSAPLFPSLHIAAFVKVMAALGLRRALLAGEEPLNRPDILELAANLAAAHPRMEVIVRTGSPSLPALAQGLARAGVTRLYAAIPSVDRSQFSSITGRPAQDLEDLMEGLKIASASGMETIVEVECRSAPDWQTISAVALWAISSGYGVKVVEGTEEEEDFTGKVLHEIGKTHKLAEGERPGAWLTEKEGAKVEIVTQSRLRNCYECQRMWLTATGKVKMCSHHHEEHDLAELFDAGCWEAELLDFAMKAPLNKPQGFFLRGQNPCLAGPNAPADPDPTQRSVPRS